MCADWCVYDGRRGIHDVTLSLSLRYNVFWMFRIGFAILHFICAHMNVSYVKYAVIYVCVFNIIIKALR